MKTSYSELCGLFRLVNERQIKAHLKNKLTVIDEDNIKVKDEELERLLTKFRNDSEVLDIQDVCDQYNITREQLLILIKEESVTHFKLSENNGSKILFFKSDLEDEKDFLLVRYRRKNDIFKFLKFLAPFFEYLLDGEKIKQQDKDIYMMYYTKEHQIDDIAHKMDLTPTRVLQIINDLNHKFPQILRFLVSYKKQNEYYKKLYFDAIIPEYKKNKISNLLLSKLDELELSIRVKNCLKTSGFDTLQNFLEKEIPKELWTEKIKNFGKKSADELEEFLKSNEIQIKSSSLKVGE